MAYDKIIDSARLDGALSATADAIRTKTGSEARIPWNESTGFSSAILAITGGEVPEIKTCTLRITVDIPFEGGYNPLGNVCVGYSKLEDGVIDNYALEEITTPVAGEIILENVVSNSPIIFDVFDDAYYPTVVFAYDSDNRMLDSVIYGNGQQTWVIYLPRDAQGVLDITITESQREQTE